MTDTRDQEYEEFRAFPDRGSADALCSWFEFEGVPCYVERAAVETQFVVFVLRKLAHRARWIVAQLPLSDAEPASCRGKTTRRSNRRCFALFRSPRST